MTTAEKIKEGCGCERRINNWDLHPRRCGKNKYSVDWLCEVCQVKLSQYKSDLQQELKFLEGDYALNYLKAVKEDKLLDSGQKYTIGLVIKNFQARINLIEKKLKEIK